MVSQGNKTKAAGAFVLLMHGGDKEQERENSKASGSGKLAAGMADIAESLKHFLSFSSHKQNKGYHPRVGNVLPAEKERKKSVKLTFAVVEERTKWLLFCNRKRSKPLKADKAWGLYGCK